MGRKFTTISRDEKSYIPKDWLEEDGKPEQNALVFKFIPLSKRQLAQFSDNTNKLAIESNTIILGTASVSIDIFRSAVVGWDNLIVDDKQYAFVKENGIVSEEAIDIIDMDIIEEVAKHILESSRPDSEAMGK